VNLGTFSKTHHEILCLSCELGWSLLYAVSDTDPTNRLEACSEQDYNIIYYVVLMALLTNNWIYSI